MDIKTVIEIIGYIGSALVLVSMLMTSVVKLRIINLTGSVIFAGYALAIRSYPTAIMNICLAGINIYHLYRIFREEKAYTLIRTDVKDGYFSYLLNSCLEDIKYWFPEFSPDDTGNCFACLVCCESNPACLFIGREKDPGVAEVVLDYAMPAYRDATAGRFVCEYMAGAGYDSLTFSQKAPDHEQYLVKLGYKPGRGDTYTLDLKKLRSQG